MVIILICALVLIVGLFLYVANTPPPHRWATIGAIMFGVGLFFCCWALQSQHIRIP